jgi:hypothetical protein
MRETNGARDADLERDLRGISAVPSTMDTTHRVDKVSDLVLGLEVVVEGGERRRGLLVVADLDELQAELERRGAEAVEPTGDVDQELVGLLAPVRGAVGEDEDDERSGTLLPGGLGAFEGFDVRVQDARERRRGRRRPAGLDAAEEAADVPGAAQVLGLDRAVAVPVLSLTSIQELDTHKK